MLVTESVLYNVRVHVIRSPTQTTCTSCSTAHVALIVRKVKMRNTENQSVVPSGTMAAAGSHIHEYVDAEHSRLHLDLLFV